MPILPLQASTTAASTTSGNKSVVLTGVPQVDYVHDPNLPRELNGRDLRDYPFYSGVPDNITFPCEGLKDGFYASVEHKCQVSPVVGAARARRLHSSCMAGGGRWAAS